MATYKIVSQYSGKVMDLNGFSTANGTQIQQFTDTGGNNQHWELALVGTLGGTPTAPLIAGASIFKIVSQVSGKVLEVNTTTNAVQQNSDAGTTIQQWQLSLVNDDGITFRIINVNTSKVIDLASASTADLTKLQQATDTGSTTQHWQLNRIDSPTSSPSIFFNQS